jgi:hypothetical protein
MIVVRGLKRLFDQIKLLGLKTKQNPSGLISAQAIIIE